MRSITRMSSVHPRQYRDVNAFQAALAEIGLPVLREVPLRLIHDGIGRTPQNPRLPDPIPRERIQAAEEILCKKENVQSPFRGRQDREGAPGADPASPLPFTVLIAVPPFVIGKVDGDRPFGIHRV